jgi:acetyltransferase-like isoleucine patch superfamily enzyme
MPHKISDWVSCLNKQGDFAGYEIGEYTYGQPKLIRFEDDAVLRIGKFCSIAADVKFMLGGNHRTDWVTTYPVSNFFEFAWKMPNIHIFRGDLTIGNDVWIGQEAFILSGVTVGDGAVIGARAVVAKDVAPYSIVVGNPARHVRFRFDEKTIEALLKIRWWDWPIEKIAEAMPMMLSEDIKGFIAKYA